MIEEKKKNLEKAVKVEELPDIEPPRKKRRKNGMEIREIQYTVITGKKCLTEKPVISVCLTA